MSMMETSEARQQIERWIEKPTAARPHHPRRAGGQPAPAGQAGRAPKRTPTGCAKKSRRCAASSARCSRTWRRCRAVRIPEIRAGERGGGTGPGRSSMSQMVQPINEMVAKLHVTQAPSLEAAADRDETPPVRGPRPDRRQASAKMLESSPAMTGVFAAQYDTLFRRPWPVCRGRRS